MRIHRWRVTDKRIFAQQNDKKKSTVQEHIYHFPNDITDALATAHVPKILVIPKLTSTQPQFIKNTFQTIKTMETSQKSTQKNSQTSIYSSVVSLVRHFLSPENEKALTIPEGHSSLTLREYCAQNSLDYSSLKTLKDFLVTTTDVLSQPSSPRLMNFGMTSNGKLLTARITESHRTGSASSLSDILEEHPDQKYFLSEKQQEQLTRDINRTPPQIEVAQTIRSRYGNGSGSHIEQLNNPKHSNDRVYGTDGVSPTLNTMQGGMRQPFVAIPEATKKGYAEAHVGQSINLSVMGSATRRGRVSDVAQTLDTGMQQHTLTSDMRIRRLTPVECERLQGFPDGWTESVSDTQRYKTLGNAVTVNVIRDVMEKLLK